MKVMLRLVFLSTLFASFMVLVGCSSAAKDEVAVEEVIEETVAEEVAVIDEVAIEEPKEIKATPAKKTYAEVAERISMPDGEGDVHSLLKRVHFGYNQIFIPYEYRKEVRAHAEFMKQETEILLILQGNADVGGHRKVHNKIGLQRAEIVKKRLVSMGVKASRISIATFGSDQPLVESDSDEAWKQNRRVDFIYYF